MSTPNPLVPQGTFAESGTKSRTRIVVFTILAAHVLFVGVLLLQGCKRTTTDTLPGESTNATGTPEPFTPPPQIFTPPTNPPETTPPTNLYTPPTNEPTPPTPVTPPPTPPTPPSAGKEHKIAQGDTFQKLAKKYGVGWKAIEDANPGIDPKKLKPNMVIKIPEAKAKTAAPATSEAAPATTETHKTYKVKSGDNLTKVAKQFGTTPKAVRALNNLKTDRIKVGDTLKIPGKAAAAAPAKGTTLPATTPAAPTGTNI